MTRITVHQLIAENEGRSATHRWYAQKDLIHFQKPETLHEGGQALIKAHRTRNCLPDKLCEREVLPR